MKGKLYAVRRDSPASRRGNFYRIFEEVRWELDLRVFKDVKLFASGGLDEKEVMELKPLVDAFGVGTCISNAPVVDYAMDIMEIEGKPVAKRGKWSGTKRVFRCPACNKGLIVPFDDERPECECGGGLKDILVPVLDNGKYSMDMPSHKEIREFVLGQLERYSL